MGTGAEVGARLCPWMLQAAPDLRAGPPARPRILPAAPDRRAAGSARSPASKRPTRPSTCCSRADRRRRCAALAHSSPHPPLPPPPPPLHRRAASARAGSGAASRCRRAPPSERGPRTPWHSFCTLLAVAAMASVPNRAALCAVLTISLVASCWPGGPSGRPPSPVPFGLVTIFFLPLHFLIPLSYVTRLRRGELGASP